MSNPMVQCNVFFTHQPRNTDTPYILFLFYLLHQCKRCSYSQTCYRGFLLRARPRSLNPTRWQPRDEALRTAYNHVVLFYVAVDSAR